MQFAMTPMPGGEYALCREYHHYWQTLPGNVTVIPQGFRWDGASYPRKLWSVTGYYPFHPSVARGSALHDRIYGGEGNAGFGVVTRAQTDAEMQAIFVTDGMPEEDAWMAYAAVRVAGSAIWMDEEDEAVALIREPQGDDETLDA